MKHITGKYLALNKTEKEFIAEWYEKLLKQVKIFPKDFLKSASATEIVLPDTRITLGPEFFGEYQIMNSRGEVILTLSSLFKAKYYIYAAISGLPVFLLPDNDKQIEETVRAYEKYFMGLVAKISMDYKGTFPTPEKAQQTAMNILQRLRLVLL